MATSINPHAAILQLKERSDKLDQKSFDWVAWKKGTLLVLQNIFGMDSAYYKQLAETDYEYSSWSLRDASGSSDPVKSSCLDLLDICRTDLCIKKNVCKSTIKKMKKSGKS
jgi:predicted alpha/beta hydrolase